VAGLGFCPADPSLSRAEDRRACPRDDIVTKLVHAQVDGGQLAPDEFGFFVILLAVAGNETTRNAISPPRHLPLITGRIRRWWGFSQYRHAVCAGTLVTVPVARRSFVARTHHRRARLAGLALPLARCNAALVEC